MVRSVEASMLVAVGYPLKLIRLLIARHHILGWRRFRNRSRRMSGLHPVHSGLHPRLPRRFAVDSIRGVPSPHTCHDRLSVIGLYGGRVYNHVGRADQARKTEMDAREPSRAETAVCVSRVCRHVLALIHCLSLPSSRVGNEGQEGAPMGLLRRR